MSTQLQPGLTPQRAAGLLSSGQVLLHSITFIEGSTFADMRNALARIAAVLQRERRRAATQEIMRALGEPELHPEGQFFPDTYRFPRGTTDLELLGDRASAHAAGAAQGRGRSRAKDLPLAGSYEALILASIVEKETALERERPQIAGVFVERLRRGMRLQTDPTVIYGMGGRVRRQHPPRRPVARYAVQHVHAAGLPPTPIALPGLESMRAAVQPDVTGALFFVATGSGRRQPLFLAGRWPSTTGRETVSAGSCVDDDPRQVHHHRRQRGRRQDDADRGVCATRWRRAGSKSWSRASRAARRAPSAFASCC